MVHTGWAINYISLAKGQLIMKCPFDVFKKSKKKLSLSALATKKKTNEENKGTLYLRYKVL